MAPKNRRMKRSCVAEKVARNAIATRKFRVFPEGQKQDLFFPEKIGDLSPEHHCWRNNAIRESRDSLFCWPIPPALPPEYRGQPETPIRIFVKEILAGILVRKERAVPAERNARSKEVR